MSSGSRDGNLSIKKRSPRRMVRGAKFKFCSTLLIQATAGPSMNAPARRSTWPPTRRGVRRRAPTPTSTRTLRLSTWRGSRGPPGMGNRYRTGPRTWAVSQILQVGDTGNDQSPYVAPARQSSTSPGQIAAAWSWQSCGSFHEGRWVSISRRTPPASTAARAAREPLM